MEAQQIADELTKYYKYVNSSYNEKDGNTLVQRITYCNGIIARSSELLAHAQYYYDKKLGEVAENLHKMGYNATVLREKLKEASATEHRLFTLCDKLNSTVKHQLEGLRSQLSYLKETIN